MAKKKAGRILKALFFAFIFAFILIALHYLYFEMSRIEGFNVNLFEDWRSYVSYVFSKIPFLKERIEYKPLRIGTASEYYRTVFSGVVKDIDAKIKELEEKQREVEKLRERYEDLIKTLEDLKGRLEGEYEKLREQSKAYSSGKTMVEELSKLFQNSEAAQIAPTLAQDNMRVETIAAALKLVPEDVAAEILQELAKIDPKKAAEVMNEIGGVDEVFKRMEDEKKSLEKLLKDVSNKIAESIFVDNLKSTLGDYFEKLSADEIVTLIVDLKLNGETIAAVLSILSRDKALKVLEILQKEHPEIFKAVIERGVKI